jgi:GNAT superfamily N-acetyltransferase
MEIHTKQNGDFEISTDQSKLNIPFIHQYLCYESYWAKNIPFSTVQKAVENSLSFGVYHHDTQIGFARIISDFSTVAYLGDVFIVESFRGQGLSKWLMETISEHPNLQGLRRWILLTADAHELYKKYGWTTLADSTRWMEKHNPNVYL